MSPSKEAPPTHDKIYTMLHILKVGSIEKIDKRDGGRFGIVRLCERLSEGALLVGNLTRAKDDRT